MVPTASATRDHPDWTLAGGGSVTHRRATKRMAF
jgi:hypothetical protein